MRGYRPDDETPPRMVLRLCRLLLTMGQGRIAWAMALNVAAGLVEGVGVLALPPLLHVLGVGADGAAPSDGLLLMAAAGYVGLIVAATWVVWARSVVVQDLSLDFLDRLRGDLHAAILGMEWAHFRTLRTAELQQTIIGEVGRISYAVTLLGGLIGALLSMPFVLGASLVLSWPLTMAALLVAGLTALLTQRLGGHGFRLGRELAAVSRVVQADLADDLAGLRIVKSFGAEAMRASGMAARFGAVRRNQIAYMRMQSSERAILHVAAALAAAATLYLAVVVLQVPLAAALVLILAYGRLLQTALRGLAYWRQLAAAVAALAVYRETLDMCREAAEPLLPSSTAAPPLRDAIRLRGVSLSYCRGDERRVALECIQADVPANRITALIGPSGSGKSTLADLLSGLTTPDHGDILIDGTPLVSGLRGAWRRRVSVVPQDPFLFHDTIAANLRLAQPDADDQALWNVLDAAAAVDFVRALPQGLNTEVGDRGIRLSGGERQRIVLARALLRQPDLLILDEATASLDGETEALVAQTLASLRGHCTVLVVAHRPSTVCAADHVLLLDAGRLVAAGSWDEVRRQAEPRLISLGMVAPK
ncbi:ABC transporter ATP-binding protein [Magnetospirillum molischianum]|uniref:ABC-type multidrug transport system n=1 Tax=Magnetospirillum molischianum DSM 120 TaxID=1150626 RepID=H8FXH2_MAGML|nr:ABC transporter ATP-binding protein [Magnetospirillum molischianum]CCG43060.1 ABC-type multidrug transport system [Magnetospirillum molischianum DSM 120]